MLTILNHFAFSCKATTCDPFLKVTLDSKYQFEYSCFKSTNFSRFQPSSAEPPPNPLFAPKVCTVQTRFFAKGLKEKFVRKTVESITITSNSPLAMANAIEIVILNNFTRSDILFDGKVRASLLPLDENLVFRGLEQATDFEFSVTRLKFQNYETSQRESTSFENLVMFQDAKRGSQADRQTFNEKSGISVKVAFFENYFLTNVEVYGNMLFLAFLNNFLFSVSGYFRLFIGLQIFFEVVLVAVISALMPRAFVLMVEFMNARGLTKTERIFEGFLERYRRWREQRVE